MNDAQRAATEQQAAILAPRQKRGVKAHQNQVIELVPPQSDEQCREEKAAVNADRLPLESAMALDLPLAAADSVVVLAVLAPAASDRAAGLVEVLAGASAVDLVPEVLEVPAVDAAGIEGAMLVQIQRKRKPISLPSVVVVRLTTNFNPKLRIPIC